MSDLGRMYRSLQPVINELAASTINPSLNRYLTVSGWEKQAPGRAGSLWFLAPSTNERVELAVPEPIRPNMPEWTWILRRLAAVEHRPASDLALSILTQYVDVARLRAANEAVIAGTIPLEAGLSLVRSAHAMLRAAGTTARRPRSQIGGSYSERGDEVVHQARMAHTEDGSFVVPIWVPLTPPDDGVQPGLFDPAEQRLPHETPERRVTRTLAQSLEAVQKVIVQPSTSPRNAQDLTPLVAAGGSRELLLALHSILVQPAVNEFEAQFSWAGGLMAPGGIEEQIVLTADAAPLLEQAAKFLRGSDRFPREIYTGQIILLHRRPGDTHGEIGIDTVRNGHSCEVRVQLESEIMFRAYEWAQAERAILVEGDVRRGPGKKLRIDTPTRVVPLDETFLVTNEHLST
jgi:hypothetical protein